MTSHYQLKMPIKSAVWKLENEKEYLEKLLQQDPGNRELELEIELIEVKLEKLEDTQNRNK